MRLNLEHRVEGASKNKRMGLLRAGRRNDALKAGQGYELT